MTIPGAIANLLTALRALQWASVVTEPIEPGAGYQIAVLPSGYREVRNFGAHKQIQPLTLRLTAHRGVTASELSVKCAAIVEAVVSDRRRGGQAHTTLMNDFEVQENEGREGVVMVAPVEIHYHA